MNAWLNIAGLWLNASLGTLRLSHCSCSLLLFTALGSTICKRDETKSGANSIRGISHQMATHRCALQREGRRVYSRRHSTLGRELEGEVAAAACDIEDAMPC